VPRATGELAVPSPPAFRLFAYGTLQVSEVLQAVIGGERRSSVPALLPGFRRFCVPGKPYPAIVADASGAVSGLLYDGLSMAELELLDYYEGELYERRELQVTVPSGELLAESYVLRQEHGALIADTGWDLGEFEREHLASYLQRLEHTRRAP
jgi:gamma-glutamylcyclotransferase (GGCT)/AIG2-like uncharacterized protein YtfP